MIGRAMNVEEANTTSTGVEATGPGRAEVGATRATGASGAPATEGPGEPPAGYVLFVCNHNAGRSQMAQAFFERYGPHGVLAESAGTTPAEQIWPVVVEVMGEAGIDISGRRPKRLTPEMQRRADLAVTMGCGDACPYVPTVVEDWDIPDPAGRPIEEVREIRDLIRAQIRELIAVRFAATGEGCARDPDGDGHAPGPHSPGPDSPTPR